MPEEGGGVIRMSRMPHIARKVFYEGRVQGVGFRYTVKRIAMGYDVAGWVRNLADGRVELEAQGEPGEVPAFLEAIEKSELGSLIGHCETRDAAPSESVKGFEIKF